MKRTKSINTTWRIALRRKTDANYRYVQTQRRPQPPTEGDCFWIRDIDGANVSAIIRAVWMIPLAHQGTIYAVEADENDIFGDPAS
jgi:hypothetical protein